MIVKNEAHVIRRCLESIRPHLSHWIVVDTGSTDDTRQTVREYLSDLPGQIYDRPWQDFSHNRNEALALARKLLLDAGRSDGHILIIDADEVWEEASGFVIPTLDVDVYRIKHRIAATQTTFLLASIIRASLCSQYEGVLHEVLRWDSAARVQVLQGVEIRGLFDSARNADPLKKYEEDAQVLERALRDDPDNPRHTFYLAQSYRDSRQDEKSIVMYRRRAELAGWEEEVWYSLYQIGVLHQRIGQEEAAVSAYLQAFSQRPTRAEPLISLAAICRTKRRWPAAHIFASRALPMANPDDQLFLDESSYTWRPLDEYAIACWWVSQRTESLRAHRVLLDHPHVPDTERPRIESNYALCMRLSSI